MINGGNLLLKTLSETQGILSEYVSRFVNANNESEFPKLVDNWFQSRSQVYFDNPQHSQHFSINTDSIDYELRNITPKKHGYFLFE